MAHLCTLLFRERLQRVGFRRDAIPQIFRKLNALRRAQLEQFSEQIVIFGYGQEFPRT
jgi:hypothetical protein